MRKCLALLFVTVMVQAWGETALEQRSMALKTDVTVRSSRDEVKRRRGYFRRHPKTITEETVFLSIEVQNLTPTTVRDLRILYQYFETEFDRPAGKESPSEKR